ncbi:MAG: TIGR01777 family oxidoreductase [Deltaproteobacteria bacterium]|nr:TIGR01777 family oxidoreductase [Deltaproteobacteria bacterium]
MKIFMTGGTGFVGTTLTRHLIAQGHQVSILTRKGPSNPTQAGGEGVSYLKGDPTRPGSWQEHVPQHDVVVNLAGASIFRKWDRKAKELIRDSRVLTTTNLVEALSGGVKKETTLLSTSAVGYYGFHGDEELDEDSPPGDDFLASVTREWEAAAGRAEAFGARVLICRFGIVLGKSGGALGEMTPLFRKGLGSPLGSGKQWFSWIHETDLVGIYLFVLNRNDLSGPINCTAPEPVRNKDLTRALGKALGKPTILPAVPGLVVKMLKGEFGSILLEGQRVLPRKLLDAGFHFQYPGIQDALHDLFE